MAELAEQSANEVVTRRNILRLQHDNMCRRRSIFFILVLRMEKENIDNVLMSCRIFCTAVLAVIMIATWDDRRSINKKRSF